MPALLTSTSIDLKRDNAVSTILAEVAGSPTCPSTRATWWEAATSLDWVIFRELATTLKPRSTNAFAIPAPMPSEAPVTMAVFGGLLIVYSEIRESTEGKRKSLHARIEKLDLELSISDGLRLSDQLIQPLFGHRAVALVVNVNSVRSARRLSIDEHAKAHGPSSRRR